jgi:hypothetical protein
MTGATPAAIHLSKGVGIAFEFASLALYLAAAGCLWSKRNNVALALIVAGALIVLAKIGLGTTRGEPVPPSVPELDSRLVADLRQAATRSGSSRRSSGCARRTRSCRCARRPSWFGPYRPRDRRAAGPRCTQSPRGDGGRYEQRSRTSSRTRFASACPRVAFITAPTIAPAAATFPPRILSTTSG